MLNTKPIHLFTLFFPFPTDASDAENEAVTPPPPSTLASDIENRQSVAAAAAAGLNYTSLAAAATGTITTPSDPNLSSTETLLRNIQGLLKVAADNARQQERQITYEKGRSLLGI